MILNTARLTIRPTRASDWKAMRVIWNDFNASPYAGYDTPHDTRVLSLRPRIALWAKANASGNNAHLFYAVCLEGQMIGFVNLNAREKGHELSYGFTAASQGHGYAREAISAILDHCRSLGLTHFTAGTALANLPSVRLLTSLGFTMTGTEQVSFFTDDDGKPIWFEGGIFELCPDPHGPK